MITYECNTPGLGGTGNLPDVTIDKLQNYFGIALRGNIGDLQKMKSAILASMIHVASNEKHDYHTYFPKAADSWCQYQRDQVNNTSLHKPGIGFSEKVIKAIKHIYEDLTKENILERCLHGKTQDANESFNAMIWERAPKTRYCGIDKLEFAVYDSIANFNYRRQATLDI